MKSRIIWRFIWLSAYGPEIDHDGIGYLANYITIEHSDGDRTNYAHLKKDSSFVKVVFLWRGIRTRLKTMIRQNAAPESLNKTVDFFKICSLFASCFWTS